MVPTSIAVRCILQHVGSMCLHQINNDLLHSPLGNCIVQQHSVDVAQLRRIYDILQKAMSIKDDQTIICTLVVMQVMRERKERERYLNTVFIQRIGFDIILIYSFGLFFIFQVITENKPVQTWETSRNSNSERNKVCFKIFPKMYMYMIVSLILKQYVKHYEY